MFFINTKIGLITKSDRLTNFYIISDVLSAPIYSSPIGLYKYIHSSLVLGFVTDNWFSNKEYIYGTIGVAPNLLNFNASAGLQYIL